jgi:hypothetical protein
LDLYYHCSINYFGKVETIDFLKNKNKEKIARYYQKEEGLHSKSEQSIEPTSMNDLFFEKINA